MMSIERRFLLIPIWAMLLFGCQTRVDSTREAQVLLQADRDFAKLSIEIGAPEAFYQFLTEDAMQFPAGSQPIEGRAAIRDAMSEGPKIALTWVPQKAEVSQSGDLGWTWGTYKASWLDTEKNAQASYGKYVNVWKKQADGAWKVAADIGNSNPSQE